MLINRRPKWPVTLGEAAWLLGSALAAGACFPPPAKPGPERPARIVPHTVSDEVWAAACELPRATRFDRFYALADEQTTEALRRLVHHCGLHDAIQWTTDLCAFQTVAAIGPPGRSPAFQDMARYLDAWATERGLEFVPFGDHDAWEIVWPGESREAERSLTFVVHGDVVPINDPPSFVGKDAPVRGWTTPPFTVVEREGRLYGRGTEDDKGPLAAALVVLQALAESGVQLPGDVALVIGNGEEHDWEGMERYAKSARPSRHVVSLDARFPVVTAESGFVRWGVAVPLGESHPGATQPRAVGVRAGLFLTQIPGEAELTLAPHGESTSALAARAERAVGEELAARRAAGEARYRGEVTTRKGEPEVVVVRLLGQSGHASKPEEAANAMWPLAAVAARLDVAPSGIRTALDIVHTRFDGDHRGERLGVAYADAMMGPLVAAPTKLGVEGGEVVLLVNMRRPRGKDHDAFRASLDEAEARLREELGEVHAIADPYLGDPHVVDEHGVLPQALLEIYRERTGDVDAKPVSIRGGTYARLFEGAVSFGPSLPGHPYRGHAEDEYIELDALAVSAEMALEALVRLSSARREDPSSPAGPFD